MTGYKIYQCFGEILTAYSEVVYKTKTEAVEVASKAPMQVVILEVYGQKQ